VAGGGQGAMIKAIMAKVTIVQILTQTFPLHLLIHYHDHDHGKYIGWSNC
jgi:hypothetical protein